MPLHTNALRAAALLCLLPVFATDAPAQATERDEFPPSITVTPDAGTFTSPSVQVSIDWCDETNLSSGTRTITLNGVNVTSSFSFQWAPTSFACGGRAQSTGTITLSPGTNSFSAGICDGSGNCSASPATYTLSTNRLAPSVSTAPHNGEYRDVSKCVASCFELSLAYRTPAYISADAPRSASLHYSSGQAAPQGFVQLDVTDSSAEPPSKMSIHVINPWGWSVTGERFYTAGSGVQRLAAQWDASSYGTGAMIHTVLVRSYWPDGSFLETSVPVRVPLVNERASPFGAGWSMPGLQRLSTADNGVVISEGDGSIAYFAAGRCWTDPLYGQICEYTSPAGDFSTLQYYHQYGEYYRTYPDKSRTTFAAWGNMVRSSDAHGESTYRYDASGRVTTVTDPAGKVLTFAYDAAGKLASVTDPAGRVSRFTVDAAGDLTHVLDPGNAYALQVTYGSDHRATRWLDRGGNEWLASYDPYGRLAQITAPPVPAEGTTLRPTTRFRALENALLPVPGYGWELSSPTPRVNAKTARAEVTTPRGATTRMALDRFGAPTRVEAPLGQVTQYSRGRHSEVLYSISPSADTVIYEYDPTGLNPVRITDRRTGRVIEMGYTSDRRLLWSRGGLHAVQNEYRLHPNDDSPQELMYSKVGSEAYYYEGGDVRPTGIVGPGGGRAFHYGRTGFMNLDSVVVSDGGRVRYRYDEAGRLAGVYNAAGDSIRYEYDALNRLVRAVDGLGQATTYGYGPLHLTSVTDAAGKVYRFSPNALGWRTSETDPQQRVANFGYDREGNLTANSNHRGQTVLFGYDVLGRPVWRDADGVRTTYSYAPDGSWVAASNSESTDTVRVIRSGPGYGWDVEQVAVRGASRHTLMSTYNVQGVRTGANGYGYSYAEDGSYRPTGISEPSFHATTVGYDNARLREFTVLPSGDSIIYERHSVRYSRAGLDNVLGLLYARDDLGRETQRARPDSAARRNVAYNARGELAALQQWTRYWTGWGWAWSLGAQVSYMYDGVRNRTESGTLEPGSNRLATWNGYSFGYDAEGNLTSKTGNGETFSYTWNSLGELASVTRNGVTTSYGYDGWGRRVRKTTGGVTTRFVYDGDHLAAELDAAGNALATYTYYPGVDRPHSMTRGGSTYYYLSDLQGNVLGLLDRAGNLVNQYRYTPWGDAEHVQEGVANPLRFAARHYDGESRMYHYRARYYDPTVGRFISQDPIGLSGGINGYAYAHNDPVNGRDPSGLLGSCGMVRTPGPIGTVVVRPGAYITGGGSGYSWVSYCYEDNVSYPTFGGGYITSGYAPGEYEDYLRQLAEQEQDARREELKMSAVNSVRAGADLAVGFTPGAATVHDISVLLSGRNYVTGQRVGIGGRTIALIGVITPISGGQLRAGGTLVTKGLGNVFSGRATVDAILNGAQRWLGPGYKQIHPGVYRSADDTRQFRMKSAEDLSHTDPHVHFESVAPDGRGFLENGHVYITP